MFDLRRRRLYRTLTLNALREEKLTSPRGKITLKKFLSRGNYLDVILTVPGQERRGFGFVYPSVFFVPWASCIWQCLWLLGSIRKMWG